MNLFSKYVFKEKNKFFDIKLSLLPSISQKNFGGIAFSDPQQFSELENVGPLRATVGTYIMISVQLFVRYVTCGFIDTISYVLFKEEKS